MPRRERVESSDYEVAIGLLIAVLELHHRATVEHCHAVEDLAAAVAARLGIDQRACELVRRTAQLHDLGKLAVPTALLDKQDPLTEEEWEVIRRHPIDGAELLLRAASLEQVAAAVRASHERWDGNGYPDGLAGETIPLAARIVAACDAFDAMTSDRPYRAALTDMEAIAELEACAATQFDPDVVQALVAELSGDPDQAWSNGEALVRVP